MKLELVTKKESLMDGLIKVAEYLRAESISFKKIKSLLFIGVDPDVGISITICEKGKNDLAIQARVPVDVDRIRRINELVTVLTERLNGKKDEREAMLVVDFDADESCLWVTDVFHEGDIEEEIDLFLGLVNFCLLPLVTYVEETGGWNEEVLLNALMNPNVDGAIGFA